MFGEEKPSCASDAEKSNQNVRKGSSAACLLGLGVGLLNGLFGAGGGMIAVPMLRWLGTSDEESHATSLAIVLPLAIASGFFYLRGGHLVLKDALPYLPGGILGALAGAWLLPRLNTLWLRRIFGAVILFSAFRLLFR